MGFHLALKASRMKEITKIRTELNDIKSRSCFFEKINKINKPLSRLIKKNRERTQINTIRNERGEIKTDTTEYKGL